MTDFSTKPLGRKFIADTRDKKFPMKAVLPQQVVIKTKTWVTGPILDQGHDPFCVGFSWRQWLLSSPVRTKTGPSPDIIYHEAQKVDEWDGENYDGTSVRAGAKVLSDKGHILSYHWAASVQDIIEFIVSSGTVVVGTSWYDNMFNPKSNGFLDVSGGLAGGHAYLLCGYSVPKKAFRVVNSWGRSWGQAGRAWIKISDFERLLAEDGEAAAAIEQPVK